MRISELYFQIKEDLKFHGGKSFKSALKTYCYNSSFRLLLNYRLGKYFYYHSWKIFHVLAARYRYKQISVRGCEISFRSKIGKNIRFAHPIGIVIGDGVIIEDNVTIWQNVTIGSHGRAGKSTSYPFIDSGAKIYVGAIIIGPVTIGRNATIGANAVVNINVPEYTSAVGVPAKVIRK